jgi:NCAIR mutase (PurE)-related protein
MEGRDALRLFEAVRRGETTPEDAVAQLKWQAPFEEIGGFAHVDLHRQLRCGTAEVIFGQGKTREHIAGILNTLQRHGEGGLATRVPADTGAYLLEIFPDGEYNEIGRTFRLRARGPEPPPLGRVVVVTAGTSDLPVAEEARVAAENWGCEVSLIADVGVAGIHRLFGRLKDIQGADAVVCVAGMEGALPSVVGGLVDSPVIAVPTSIGYGAHFHGLASLLGMLNSCASNVVVVNIDAGFSGGHVAGLIARRMGQARQAARASASDAPNVPGNDRQAPDPAAAPG